VVVVAVGTNQLSRLDTAWLPGVAGRCPSGHLKSGGVSWPHSPLTCNPRAMSQDACLNSGYL
jgi:hypothetical protein